MTYDMPVSKKTACGVVGVVAILFYFWLLTWSAPLYAAPGFVAKALSHASLVEQAKIYKRGRTPIYPYKTTEPGPRGWTGYFGFVPYTKGDIGTQALQRHFNPQDTWPLDPNAEPPRPWGN